MALFKNAFLLTLPVSCALFSVAHADVTYTVVNNDTFVKSPSHSDNADEEIDTFFVAPHKTREEMEFPHTKGGAPNKEIFVTRCDLHQVFSIDDSLKIYSVSTISKDGIPKPLTVDGSLPKDIREVKTVMHFSVQKLAAEKVNGFDTQCYLIVTTLQGNGYAGNPKAISKVKIWVAHVPGWQSCNPENSPFTSSTDIVTTPKGNIKNTMEFTGDVNEMNKINAEFFVRSKGTIERPHKNITYAIDENVTSFARMKKLDDSLFEVPAGYRKVSSEEYDKLQLQGKNKAVQKSKHSKPKQGKSTFHSTPKTGR